MNLMSSTDSTEELLQKEESELTSSDATPDTPDAGGLLQSLKRLSLVRLLMQRKIVVAVHLYVFLGGVDVMWETVFPLWLIVSVTRLVRIAHSLFPSPLVLLGVLSLCLYPSD
jgi:hypothetical protein